MKLVALLIAVSASTALAACPNRCSGHGTCGSADKCTCQPRWTGQDCSLRECPFGLSWTAEGSGVVPAGGGLGGLHPYTECSSKGSCDRSSGECECYPGYEGRGCRRQQCPNDCSGNGRCVYNQASNSTYVATNAAKFGSQFWDAAATRVCACDRGWQGYDCSVRICPKGDDPITDCSSGGATAINSAAHNMVQRLYVNTDNASSGDCTTQSAAQTGIMKGLIRSDQTSAVCVATETADPACTNGGGVLDISGRCIMPVLTTAACTAEANDNVWTENKCNPNLEAGTGLNDEAQDHKLYGYISLKYTDMFGGEYFTRPILIDTSRAATQSSHLASRGQQWATSKDSMYYGSSYTGALRTEGTCATNTLYTEAACVAAGAVWTHTVTGFHLDGTQGASHDSLAADRMKRNYLKRYTADRIRDALQDLPNFAIPSVNVTNFDGGNSLWGNIFDITFSDTATTGKQNLLECVYDTARSCDGAQPKMAHSTTTTASATAPLTTIVGTTFVQDCQVFEVPLATGDTYEENSECANRGLCDGSTGICECFEGHTGENCATQTIFF